MGVSIHAGTRLGKRACLLQALEQAQAEAGALGGAREHGRRQLLRVPHQHQPPPGRQQLQGDERGRLHRLPRLRARMEGRVELVCRSFCAANFLMCPWSRGRLVVMEDAQGQLRRLPRLRACASMRVRVGLACWTLQDGQVP